MDFGQNDVFLDPTKIAPYPLPLNLSATQKNRTLLIIMHA